MNLDPRSFDPRAFGVPEPETLNSDDASQSLAEDCARAMWPRDAASRALGMRLDEITAGTATIVMTVRADMLNAHGSCHGGLLFALADSAFGYACNSRNRVALAAGCQIEFLAPAHEGDVLRAEAGEAASAGRSGVYDVRISNQDGATLAVFRGRSREVAGSVIGEASSADDSAR